MELHRVQVKTMSILCSNIWIAKKKMSPFLVFSLKLKPKLTLFGACLGYWITIDLWHLLSHENDFIPLYCFIGHVLIFRCRKPETYRLFAKIYWAWQWKKLGTQRWNPKEAWDSFSKQFLFILRNRTMLICVSVSPSVWRKSFSSLHFESTGLWNWNKITPGKTVNQRKSATKLQDQKNS